MNKKASLPTEMLKWLGNITLVMVVVIFIFMVAVSFLNEKFDTRDLEVYTLSRSLLYSENCLALSDEFKVSVGVIDIEKLTPEKLSSCYSKEDFGYTVKLSDIDNNEIAFVNPKFNINYNIPICAGVKFYKCSNNKYYVLYKKDNKILPGILDLEVITIVQ